jgi:hypothetical protein
MSANSVAPGAQQKRFAAYLDRLAQAAGHSDRAVPLKSYCTGLLLPGERKSVEPMAARLCPDNVRQTHQSLHHVLAHAQWNNQDLLEAVRQYTLLAMQKQGAIAAWVVDDTGFVKKGTHSVGVSRQYCGQVGKQENCRVAVSLSISTAEASLPVAWATLPAGSLDRGQETQSIHGHTARNPFSNQAGNRFATSARRCGSRNTESSGAGRCRLWQRHQVSRGHHRIGFDLCGGYPVLSQRVATSPSTPAQAKWKGIGRPTKLLRRDARHTPVWQRRASVRRIAMTGAVNLVRRNGS